MEETPEWDFRASGTENHAAAAEAGVEAGDPAGQEDPSALLASMYPSPPTAYARFTERNLWFLRVLQAAEIPDGEKPWEELDQQARMARQGSILRAAIEQQRDKNRESATEQQDPVDVDGELPDFDVLLEMAPPNVDWIREDGSYTVFGVAWPAEDRLPTLEDVGIKRLYAEGPIDRRAVLKTLLRTLLHTHLRLSTAVLTPPNEYSVDMIVGHQPGPDGVLQPILAPTYRTEAQDLLEHLRLVVINFQHLINEMRPRQAKENLRATLRAQLERRKQQTQVLTSECSIIRSRIAALRQGMHDTSTPELTSATVSNGSSGDTITKKSPRSDAATQPPLPRVRIEADQMDES